MLFLDRQDVLIYGDRRQPDTGGEMTLIRVTPSELRAFDARCRGDAATIEQVTRHVAKALEGLDWDSPAAHRFRLGWETDFRPALDKLGLALRELGSAASRMAENYEAAEAAFKG
jgi:uncharacterized protein YukE